MKRILSLVLPLCFAGLATADCVRQRVVVHRPAAVAAPVVAVPVIVPAYSASYSIPEELEKLKKRIEDLEKRGVGGARRPGEVEPVGPPIGEKAVRILQKHCVECHSGEAAKKGVKIFLDDKTTFNPLVDRAKVIRAVYRGQMPPAGPLSQEDADAVMDGLGR